MQTTTSSNVQMGIPPRPIRTFNRFPAVSTLFALIPLLASCDVLESDPVVSSEEKVVLERFEDADYVADHPEYMEAGSD